MSFEKQECFKCKKFVMCYLRIDKGIGFWFCDPCYSWVIEEAGTKDQVRAIMIECGIEDLE